VTHSFQVIRRAAPDVLPVRSLHLRSAGKNMKAAISGPVDDERSVIIIGFDVEPCRLLTRHDRNVVRRTLNDQPHVVRKRTKLHFVNCQQLTEKRNEFLTGLDALQLRAKFSLDR
jgi:hypothetical protein